MRVGLGQDGIRDYWSPYGNGDLLGQAWQLAFRSGLRYDHDIEGCVDVASRGGRACIDGQPWSTAEVVDDPVAGLGVGAAADLLVLAAETVTSAVMDRPDGRLVIHEGRVIARDGVLC